MLLRLGAQPFMRWLSLPEPLALLISGLLILGVLVGAGYLFGTRITGEFQDVTQRALSATRTSITDWMVRRGTNSCSTTSAAPRSR